MADSTHSPDDTFYWSPRGSPSVLREVDPLTGTHSVIANISGGAPAISWAVRLTASSTGQLFVMDRNNGLYTIEKTTVPPTFVGSPGVKIFSIAFGGSGEPGPSNEPPVADAGPDQTVECTGTPTAGCATVTLDGTPQGIPGHPGSSDPDGDALTYTWTWNDPDPKEIAGAGLSPILKLGTYTVMLTVDDGNGGTDTDTVTVTVVDTTRRWLPPRWCRSTSSTTRARSKCSSVARTRATPTPRFPAPRSTAST